MAMKGTTRGTFRVDFVKKWCDFHKSYIKLFHTLETFYQPGFLSITLKTPAVSYCKMYREQMK